MEYIEIENGKVKGHYSSKKVPEGNQYKTVKSFGGYVGCDIKMLNDDGSLKSKDELLSLGIIKDERGTYYNVETKNSIEITEIGMNIPEGYTKEKPKVYHDWDGEKWVINESKKTKYENDIKLSNAYAFLRSTDYKVIKAIEQGKTLDELYEGESVRREEARMIIRTLGGEK